MSTPYPADPEMVEVFDLDTFSEYASLTMNTDKHPEFSEADVRDLLVPWLKIAITASGALEHLKKVYYHPKPGRSLDPVYLSTCQGVIRDVLDKRYLSSLDPVSAPFTTPEKIQLNCVLGAYGEAGEVAREFLESVIFRYRKLDLKSWLLEWMDLGWYVTNGVRTCGVALSRASTLLIRKLWKRHEDGKFNPDYSSEVK